MYFFTLNISLAKAFVVENVRLFDLRLHPVVTATDYGMVQIFKLKENIYIPFNILLSDVFFHLQDFSQFKLFTRHIFFKTSDVLALFTEIFGEALQSQPAAIIFDDIDKLIFNPVIHFPLIFFCSYK